MHPTAMDNGKLFFDTYVSSMKSPVVMELGSQDVNGSLREVSPANVKEYIGVDFIQAKGVDVILEDPYQLPFADESMDVIVSSSCLEHSEMFWLVFLEKLRILKPNGVMYLNVPSNAQFHRYPVDCWRFYPDAANALVTWGKRSGYAPALLESFTTAQRTYPWNDFVSVIIKDEAFVSSHPNRIVSSISNFTNGLVHGSSDFLNPREWTEDQLRIFGHIA